LKEAVFLPNIKNFSPFDVNKALKCHQNFLAAFVLLVHETASCQNNNHGFRFFSARYIPAAAADSLFHFISLL
jgi:hypothetical protein